MMLSNLRKGDAGEAFARWWLDANLALPPGVRLSRFGFNPAGLDQSKGKADRLKQDEKSPDFAILRGAGQAASPLVGISVNSQRGGYGAKSASERHLCEQCARGVFSDCLAGNVRNLWYNEYNVRNDYQLFREAFGAEVVMMTVIAPWMSDLGAALEREGLDEAMREFAVRGAGARVARLVSEYAKRGFEIRWVARTQIHPRAAASARNVPGAEALALPRVHVSITANMRGAKNYARPIVCISQADAGDAESLARTLNAVACATT